MTCPNQRLVRVAGPNDVQELLTQAANAPVSHKSTRNFVEGYVDSGKPLSFHAEALENAHPHKDPTVRKDSQLRRAF